MYESHLSDGQMPIDFICTATAYYQVQLRGSGCYLVVPLEYSDGRRELQEMTPPGAVG